MASPSGDLIAAFSTYKEDVDVVLFGVPDRSLFRNLTQGKTTDYQYLVAQMLTVGPDRGRDLAFSPDGDPVAVFARRERGRVLVARRAPRRHRPHDPIPGPGHAAGLLARRQDHRLPRLRGGHADIYLLDLATEKITQPHQRRGLRLRAGVHARRTRIVYSSQSGEDAKLFEIALANPSSAASSPSAPATTRGPPSPATASASTSPPTATAASSTSTARPRDPRAHASDQVIGAAINPVAVPTRDGERVIYQAYTKGRYRLYVTDPAQGTPAGNEEAPQEVTEREPYVPAVTVTISQDKIEPVKRQKLFVDNAQVLVGVNSDKRWSPRPTSRSPTSTATAAST